MYRHSLVHVLLLFQQQNEEEFDSDKGPGPSSEMKPISNEADTIDLVHPFSSIFIFLMFLSHSCSLNLVNYNYIISL